MKSPLILLALAVVLALMVFLADKDRDRAAANNSSPAAVPSLSADQDAAAGELLVQRCSGCHPLQQVASHRHDLAGWEATVKRMESRGVALSPDQEQLLVTYLANHFGPQ
jgi:cytochrome c5